MCNGLSPATPALPPSVTSPWFLPTPMHLCMLFTLLTLSFPTCSLTLTCHLFRRSSLAVPTPHPPMYNCTCPLDWVAAFFISTVLSLVPNPGKYSINICFIEWMNNWAKLPSNSKHFLFLSKNFPISLTFGSFQEGLWLQYICNNAFHVVSTQYWKIILSNWTTRGSVNS